MAICNITSGQLSGINPFLSVPFSQHMCIECVCEQWHIIVSVIVVCFWSLQSECVNDCLNTASVLSRVTKQPFSCCDVVVSSGFTFVLRKCKHSNAYHEYRWIQKHELYTSILVYSVHAIRIIVTVNEHCDPCSAIYSPHCVYFKQLPVVSYRSAPSVKQCSLSFISALLIMYIVKSSFSISSEGFRRWMSDFLIPYPNIACTWRKGADGMEEGEWEVKWVW